MSTSLHSSARDVTAVQRQAQPTLPTAHHLLAMCGHKTARAGAQMRGKIVLRCASCAEGKR